MASKILSSLLPIFLILAIAGEAAAARNLYGRSAIDDNKKPQWFVEYDGVSVLIPGVGRVTLPPYDKGNSGDYTGSNGSNTGGAYIPGGDDTLVPNPGYEVPNPANVGTSYP